MKKIVKVEREENKEREKEEKSIGGDDDEDTSDALTIVENIQINDEKEEKEDKNVSKLEIISINDLPFVHYEDDHEFAYPFYIEGEELENHDKIEILDYQVLNTTN